MNGRYLKPNDSFGFGIFPESDQESSQGLENPAKEHPPNQVKDGTSGESLGMSFGRQANHDKINESSAETTPGNVPTPGNTDKKDGHFRSKQGRGTVGKPTNTSVNQSTNFRPGRSPDRKAGPMSKRPPSRPGALPSRNGPVGKRGEPLCLAELLALERSQGFVEPDYDQTYERLKQSGDATYLSELEKMPLSELIEEARRQSVENANENATRQDLLFQILKMRIKRNGLMFGEGTLEILPDQFGFLRSAEYHYLSSPDDIYISPSQIRRFGLRPGCTVSGQIRPPKENERYFALLRVEAINHEEPASLNSKPIFENLTPVYPNEQIVLDPDGKDFDLKLVDRLVPLGFGQRGLLVSPPRSGKTVLLRKMARATLDNHPNVYVFMLLLDERPEEATEMARLLKEPRCEVICSLFEEPASRHVHVAEIVLEKAKRMVECGHNVVIFLDSLTQLARAWSIDPSSDSQLGSGNPENLNSQPVKRFFGSARKAEEGGSLTIVATLYSETGQSFDDSVLNTFKGTGNWELHLDRELAEKRIWPAINIHKSSAKHEENLLSPEQFKRSLSLRRQVSDMSIKDALNHLADNV